MKKATYLANTEVAQFCSWFSQTLIGKLPILTQTVRDGSTVTFHGLPDALAKYDWRFTVAIPGASTVITGRTYAENVMMLGTLAAGLRGAIGSGIDSHVRDWSIAVMAWGGVTAHNAAWLTANTSGLHAHVTAQRTMLSADDDDLIGLSTAITRFNAGMSKVYSLILDQFIIYDSRVAGAVASFVCEWCVTSRIPDPLAFACLPAKENQKAMRHKRRNPCSKIFPSVYSRPHLHAHWNLRASWVLAESLRLAGLKAPGNAFAMNANPLRALEAALFMWGYDLPVCTRSRD